MFALGAGVLEWRFLASDAANPSTLDLLLDGTVLQSFGLHHDADEPIFQGAAARGLGADIILGGSSSYRLRLTNPAIDFGAGAVYYEDSTANAHITAITGGFRFEWEDHGGPVDFNDYRIEIRVRPPGVLKVKQADGSWRNVGCDDSDTPGRLKLWTGRHWAQERCPSTTGEVVTAGHPLKVWDGTVWQVVACMEVLDYTDSYGGGY